MFKNELLKSWVELKQIDFYKNKLILDVSGALFWPLKKAAIVSDLHLKSSYLAKKGNFYLRMKV